MNATTAPTTTCTSSSRFASLRAQLMRLPRPVRIALLVAAAPVAATLGVLVVSAIAELVLLVVLVAIVALLYFLSIAPSPSAPIAIATGMLVAVQAVSWI